MLQSATPATSPVRTAQGIPTFCASGDDGPNDNDKGLNVDYPASSPFSFGCGGTTITLNDIDTEIGWEHAGGGISRIYPLPAWQVLPPGYLHSVPSAWLCNSCACPWLRVTRNVRRVSWRGGCTDQSAAPASTQAQRLRQALLRLPEAQIDQR